MISSRSAARRPVGYLLKLLCLLWLIGASARIPILAVPPAIPLIHDDLHLSETQIGLLIGLPLVLFALAAVPGSLLIARLGVGRTITVGLAVAAVASAARGASIDVMTLYLATAVTGLGIAITQPALPQLVREWTPQRIGLGTAVYTNGLLLGTTSTAALTIPVMLPALGGSWRLGFVAWAVPVVATVLLYILLRPRDEPVCTADATIPVRWWPDWGSPVTWLLGFTFGGNNCIYFGCNAFLPDYLTAQGRPDLIGAALGWINGAQLLASFVLLLVGEKVHRRVWPFPVFGLITLTALIATMVASGPWVVVLAAVIGFATSVSFVMVLALPPVLSAPQDVHRTAAGMFTISFTCAVIVPTISGGVWDVTGAPWTAFVPLAVGAVALTAFGTVLSRRCQVRA